MESQLHKEQNSLESLGLTNRELDVLACLTEHQATKDMVPILGIQPRTVDLFVGRLMSKFGKSPRGNLIKYIRTKPYIYDLKARYTSLLRESLFMQKLTMLKKAFHHKKFVFRVTCQDDVLKIRAENDLEKIGIQISRRRQDVPIFDLELTQNYELNFLKTLNQLIFTEETKMALQSFESITNQEQEQKKEQPIHDLLNQFIEKHKEILTRNNKYYIFGVICIAISMVIFVVMHTLTLQPKNNVRANPNKKVYIRSHDSLPIVDKLLTRQHFLNEIKASFKDKNCQSIVALVGVGGSGKTTIACQYADTLGIPVVSEISATNEETLFTSFLDLAQEFQKTQEERNEIERIKKVEDRRYALKQLIHFIKQKLVLYQPWFLIFDDVSSLEEIQEYLPNDPKTCGQGHVLVTTCNNTIAHGGLMKQSDVILVNELNSKEKLDLFLKTYESSNIILKKTEDFLRILPPFPLDITVAAKYIKNTNSSYDEYKELIQKKNSETQKIPSLTTKIGGYSKTRQSIIACAIDRMLGQNKDFIPLLLLVSTIDHQKIPKELLKKCSKFEVFDAFIQGMCESSLLSCHKQTEFGPMFSIHRSMQEAVFRYLEDKIPVEERGKHLSMLSDLLFDYCKNFIKLSDYFILPILLPHILSFSKYVEGFDAVRINSQLGCMYYHKGDYIIAEKYFEKVRPILSSSTTSIDIDKEKKMLLAKTLIYLCATKTHMSQFEEAQKFITQSLKMYHAELGKEEVDYAFALMHRGRLLREMGNYEAAEKDLQKSRKIYEQYYGDKHPETAWVQFRLGEVYARLGKMEQAKECYQKSLKIYQNQERYGQDHRRTLLIKFHLGKIDKTGGYYKKALPVCEQAYEVYKNKYKEDRTPNTYLALHLGDIYRLLGLYEKARSFLELANNAYNEQYTNQQNIFTARSALFLGLLYADSGQNSDDFEKARKIIEQSLDIHSKTLGKHHIKTMLVKRALGRAYIGLRQYDRARHLYQECLEIFKKHFGEHHVEYADIMYHRGYLYLLENDFEKAEKMLKKALCILEKNKHTTAYRCYECLGDLYKQLGKKTGSQKAYAHAFCIAKYSFPKNSAHLVRLKKKISFIQRIKLSAQQIFNIR